jgi:hypothetical protein
MTCIDAAAVTNDERATSCKSTKYSGSGGQGAPIVITSVEPEILLQNGYLRPQFNIKISNIGKGYVTNANSCDEMNKNANEQANYVTVSAYLSNENTPLECGPNRDGIVNLGETGETIVRCFLPQDDNNYAMTEKNYITPLTINIDYTYRIINNLELEILRNDNVDPNAQATQGTCNSYQVEYNGKCVSKCEYCAQHGSDMANCQENKPFDGFTFNNNFACSCNLDQCNDKLGKGSCIKGYCPGGVYCCSTQNCDAYQVEYRGNCINKCDYCRDNPTDKKVCGTSIDFSNAHCFEVSKETLDKYTSVGATIRNYCGGQDIDKYCIDMNKGQAVQFS